jgi:hypothetical protein
MADQLDDLRRRYNILPIEAFLPGGRQMAAAAT